MAANYSLITAAVPSDSGGSAVPPMTQDRWRWAAAEPLPTLSRPAGAPAALGDASALSKLNRWRLLKLIKIK